jgi:hypothetical protein
MRRSFHREFALGPIDRRFSFKKSHGPQREVAS